MGNKSFESKMNNASHDYIDGRHVPKPHPDSQYAGNSEYKSPKYIKEQQEQQERNKPKKKSIGEKIAQGYLDLGEGMLGGSMK